MTTQSETRYARVTSQLPTADAKTVAAYLPANYRVATDEHFGGDDVIIEGEDQAGWTLDDYVIPRLASGLMTCVEQFVHMEDDGDGESGPHLSVWLEDFPMGKVAEQVEPCAICVEPVSSSEMAEMALGDRQNGSQRQEEGPA